MNAGTKFISDKTFTSLEGFIGRDPVRSEIVLAFRGSESIRNWIADLTLGKTSVSPSFLELIEFLAMEKVMLQLTFLRAFHTPLLRCNPNN